MYNCLLSLLFMVVVKDPHPNKYVPWLEK